MEWPLKVIAKSFLKVVHTSYKFTDGVGTTLKKHAMKKVIKRKCVITNAGEFYNAVKDSNIQVTMMITCELERYSLQHPKTIFRNAIPIPGITAFHFIEFTDNGFSVKPMILTVKRLSIFIRNSRKYNLEMF